MKNTLEKARVEYDAFMDRVLVNHPEVRTGSGGGTPFAIDDAKNLLRSQEEVIVECQVLDERVYVFVVAIGADGEIQVRTYPVVINRHELTRRVNWFRERIMSPDLDASKLSADLFQLLLGPAEQMLKGKKTVILVPDDALWELPFQALRVNGHYLIEDHAIFYAPSLTVLREMKKRKSLPVTGDAVQTSAGGTERGSAQTLLAFGDPAISAQAEERLKSADRSETLGPIPAAKKEVETLRELYGTSNSAVYVGTQATEERAKADMSRFRVLHFATHGILDGMNPLYSHVVLSRSESDSSEDGLLEAREIMQMDLNADLVVLSACQTGRGRISQGEGVVGMSWALFVAGCPTSVVSQWNAESNSTTRLMIEFHRALLSLNQGSSRVTGSAEALRQAALKMLKTPGFSAPVLWAGFIVVGDGW